MNTLCPGLLEATGLPRQENQAPREQHRTDDNRVERQYRKGPEHRPKRPLWYRAGGNDRIDIRDGYFPLMYFADKAAV